MNIHAVIPVWSGTRERVLYCVEALSKWIDSSHIYLLNDVNKPLGTDIIGKLPGDVNVWGSVEDRCGNMNGMPIVRKLVNTMRDIAVANNADFVCKIDPDTLLLNPNFLTKLAADGCPFFDTKRKGKPYGGSFYMMSRNTCEAVAKVIDTLDIKGPVQEDIVIGSAAQLVNTDKPIITVDEAATLDKFVMFAAADCREWCNPAYINAVRSMVGILNYGTAGIIPNAQLEDETLFAKAVLGKYQWQPTEGVINSLQRPVEDKKEN